MEQRFLAGESWRRAGRSGKRDGFGKMVMWWEKDAVWTRRHPGVSGL